MFIVELTYVRPLSEADAHMEDHMAWVDAGYQSGLFLASGRKNPRTGGVILARGSLEAVEAHCAADPFARHGVARYTITEMVVSRTSEGLQGLLS